MTDQIEHKEERHGVGRRSTDGSCPDHQGLVRLMKWVIGLVTFLIFTTVTGVGSVGYMVGQLTEKMNGFNTYAANHNIEAQKYIDMINAGNAKNQEQDLRLDHVEKEDDQQNKRLDKIEERLPVGR